MVVCILPIYSLRGVHNKMNIPADFTLNVEDFQLRNLQPLSLALQFQVCHFVRMLMPCVYLDIHAVCLFDHAKNSYSPAFIISYIEHTHHGSDCHPFRTLVGMTYMLPFSENVLCIEIKIQKNHSY